MTQYVVGEIEIKNGNFEASLDYLRKMYNLNPENLLCKFAYGRGLAYTNRFEKSIKILNQVGRDTTNIWIARLTLFFNYALQNKKTKALQFVSADLKTKAEGDEQAPLWMAQKKKPSNLTFKGFSLNLSQIIPIV